MNIRIFLLMVLALVVAAVMAAVKHDSYPLVTPAITAPGSAASSTAACTLDACPFTITDADSGKTFTYAVTSRFTVMLDEAAHPQEHLKCAPEGIIGSVSNAPSQVPAGSYAARFEGVAPGTCELSTDGFHATIVIAGLQ